ncbi:hypothetical protein [Streptomyces sp. RK9]|uniref:hypothetical protein n=1 Tax=Streptomyces sp. RK9 TaxID=3239284 RepID=UPI00386AB261
MADPEQQFRETMAQYLADQIAVSRSVDEVRDFLMAFAAKLGSFEEQAKEYFEGVVERIAKGEDHRVIAEELKQEILAL